MNYNNTILYGDALEMLTDLPRQTVQMCVTSPPYWGLRDYGTGEWTSGDPECKHIRTEIRTGKNLAASPASSKGGAKKIASINKIQYTQICEKCGAKRTDFQIGLEPDLESYVIRLVKVFREVKRVLKNDGTLWLNLGDSYAGSGSPGGDFKDGKGGDSYLRPYNRNPQGLKPKDLCMIPARVAMALQADGWYLRSEIIWHKPNCMPESVKDRPTNAHEKIYLFSKSRTYYYDWQAIAEPLASSTMHDSRTIDEAYTEKRPQRDYPGHAQNGSGMLKPYGKKRNKRTVWQVPLRPYKGAHFAVYPPDLIVPCIKAGSKKEDLVLDPFFGSGTTGEVAKALGRYYLGIELNKEYADLQHHRLNQHSFYF